MRLWKKMTNMRYEHTGGFNHKSMQTSLWTYPQVVNGFEN